MSNGGLISGAFSSGDGGFNLSQKGQIHTYSTTQAALNVGANDTILTADSTETTGIKWGAASAGGAWTSLETQTDGDTFDIGAIGGSLFSSYRFIRIIGQYRGGASANFACTTLNSTTTVTDYDQVYINLQDSTYSAPATSGAVSMFLGYTENNNTIFFDIFFPVSITSGASHGQLMFKSCSSGNNLRNWIDGISWIVDTDDISGIVLSTGTIVAGSCSYEVLGLA